MKKIKFELKIFLLPQYSVNFSMWHQFSTKTCQAATVFVLTCYELFSFFIWWSNFHWLFHDSPKCHYLLFPDFLIKFKNYLSFPWLEKLFSRYPVFPVGTLDTSYRKQHFLDYLIVIQETFLKNFPTLTYTYYQLTKKQISSSIYSQLNRRVFLRIVT